MSNNKQSSVDWLFSKLIDKEYKNPHDTELILIIEQAKAMHKEETLKIVDDYEAYLDYLFKNQCGGQAVVKTFEEYYNETFNTREK